MYDASRNQPTGILFLICGFIGSGKTTHAAVLAEQHTAQVFTLDEWVNAHYGPDADLIKEFDPQERAKSVMWQNAERLLEAGTNVILDWGFWRRVERDEYRARAAQLGASCRVIFMTADRETCYQRAAARNVNPDQKSVPINLQKFDRWWTQFEPPAADESYESGNS